MIGEQRFSQLAFLWPVFIAAICIARPMQDPKKYFKNVLNRKPRATASSTQSVRVGVLYSKNTGKHVRILHNKIDGRGTETDRNAKLIFESAGFGGQVRIRSYYGNLYLCLSSRGDPVVEQARIGKTKKRCVFIDEHYIGGYTTYRSKVNPKWFFGIRNNGKAKPARKINVRQRAAHFLSRETV